MTVSEVGWDDKNAATGGSNRPLERFKAKQGATHRIAILTDKPLRSFSHYKKGYGYFSCLKAEGMECVACAANDRPSEKFACNILVYPQGAEPNATWDINAASVMLWQPGPKVFNDLRAIRSEWGPITSYDLKVSCTNAQFQHLNIINTSSLLWTLHPQAQSLADRLPNELYDLRKIVGIKDTVAEVTRIWTTNVTRDEIKAGRKSVTGGETSTTYSTSVSSAHVQPSTATQVPAAVKAQEAPAAMPNFASLLRGKPAGA